MKVRIYGRAAIVSRMAERLATSDADAGVSALADASAAVGRS